VSIYADYNIAVLLFLQPTEDPICSICSSDKILIVVV